MPKTKTSTYDLRMGNVCALYIETPKCKKNVSKPQFMNQIYFVGFFAFCFSSDCWGFCVYLLCVSGLFVVFCWWPYTGNTKVAMGKYIVAIYCVLTFVVSFSCLLYFLVFLCFLLCCVFLFVVFSCWLHGGATQMQQWEKFSLLASWFLVGVLVVNQQPSKGLGHQL